jgi:hypothetical protein
MKMVGGENTTYSGENDLALIMSSLSFVAEPSKSNMSA